MKKSDMIKLIASDLVCEYTGFLAFDEAQELAEILLRNIEKEGMLPPGTMRYIDKENGNTLCSEVCEWEPENDDE